MLDGIFADRASTWPAWTRRGFGRALLALTLATSFLGATPRHGPGHAGRTRRRLDRHLDRQPVGRESSGIHRPGRCA
jgi:hypothetical protein